MTERRRHAAGIRDRRERGHRSGAAPRPARGRLCASRRSAVPIARNADRHVSVRHLAALKTFERAIVRRKAVDVGPPSAILLLDRVPQCRSAGMVAAACSTAFVARLRARGAAPSPADRLAAQLADLDDELLRFSTGANRRVSDAVGFDSARWFDAVGTRAAAAGRIGRISGSQVHASNARTSRTPRRCSRARTAGCSARCPGAAPKSNA